MKKLFFLSSMFITVSWLNAQEKLPVITAAIDVATDISTVDGEQPAWCSLTPAIGKASSSSSLKSQGTNTYTPANANDCDINTAWVEGKTDHGKGEYLEFVMQPGFILGDRLYLFSGKCNILNGYAKNEKSWSENSRVKKFRVYHNGTPLCTVDLKDARKIQSFDLSPYFDLSEMQVTITDEEKGEITLPVKGSFAENYNTNNWNEGASIKLKSGDVLRFEIIEVYPGKKWKDTAITEFWGGR